MMNETLGFTAALGAALDSKLLESLFARPQSAREHAAALGLDVRATERVLDVLAAFGVASRSGERFGAAPDLVDYLERSPGGPTLSLPLWAHARAFLRTGTLYVQMDAAREATYANVVAALGHMAAPVAAEVASKLDRAPTRVLDIGCGSGVWSLAIARRFAEAHVTGLDLPAVLEAFRARAAEQGIGPERLGTIAGDVHSVDIPRAFDLVVIANVLRIEAPDKARSIVRRAAAALVPGGRVLVVDALASGTPAREQARAVYALHLAMRTDHGRVYSPDEISAWLSEAGLSAAPIHLDGVEHAGAIGALLATQVGASAGDKR